MIEFTVLGTPQPQGSAIRGRFGGIHDANRALAPWRQAVIAEAIRAMEMYADEYPITRPVTVELDAYFVRPKSHYRTGKNAGMVREAVAGMAHAQKPDLDKLQRALGDALTIAGVIRDDSLITRWLAAKWWADSAFMSVLVSEEP